MIRPIGRRVLFAVAFAVLSPLSFHGVGVATAQNGAQNTPQPATTPSYSVPSNTVPSYTVPSYTAAQPAAVSKVPFGWGAKGNSASLSPADLEREAQTRKLLSDYSQTEDEKQHSKILDDLTKVVSEQFDARQEARERELKELEEQVHKMRELQQRRAKEKDQITRDRVRQLLRDVDGLGWGEESRGNGPIFQFSDRPGQPVSIKRPGS